MNHDSLTDGGFYPDNVLAIMTSPLSATGVPAATGRTEIVGIGVQSYPIGWFTSSNFGGRFGSMLKFAGYDGIVIEGQAETPVWIDIRDDSIWIRACGDLNLFRCIIQPNLSPCVSFKKKYQWDIRKAGPFYYLKTFLRHNSPPNASEMYMNIASPENILMPPDDGSASKPKFTTLNSIGLRQPGFYSAVFGEYSQ